jgi:lysozyme family protein
MNLADIIQGILTREGAEYSDRGADRGGPTKYGITLATLSSVRKRPCTAADVEALTGTEAYQIYIDRYVTAPGFYRISDVALQMLCVDAGVQHGTGEAVKMLQRAAGVNADGILGNGSLAAINSHDPKSLYARVCAARVRLYGELVSHDPNLAQARAAGFHLQAENAFGWANRIAGLIEDAL